MLATAWRAPRSSSTTSSSTRRKAAREKDADELLDLVVRAVDGTLSQAGGVVISGVAMSTFWHSVLGLDRDGRPTTPILTWADRRAAECVPDLRERLDERANHRRTGCVPHSSYWPAKLLWSSCVMPETIREDGTLGLPRRLLLRPFLRGAVSGRNVDGLGNGPLRPESAEVGPRDVESPARRRGASSPPSRMSPEVVWPENGQSVGRPCGDTPWLPAVGDGACSNVGSGCTGSDRLALDGRH